MATRSTIAIELPDGTVAQVYCHWDGYLENNGKLLFEEYDYAKTMELIEHGDLSSLGVEIGEQHDFDDHDPYVCTFYGRDRDQDDCDADYFDNFDDYSKNASFEDYNYILRNNGEWHFRRFGDVLFSSLKNELEHQHCI